MAKHVIRPIPLNKISNMPQQFFTYLTGVGPTHSSANTIWYIEGPEKKIIVDAGGSSETARMIMHFLAPQAIVEDIQSLENGLNHVGLKPEDIDIVILTHLHNDHLEMAHKFTNAKFIVQRADLDFIDNPHPSVAGACANKDALKGLALDVVEGDREVLDGINLWLTPGHTPGGQSVIVDTAKGKAVITGFCCIRENFEPPAEVKAMMPVIPPGVHIDVRDIYDSVIKVKEFADIVIPLHDAGAAEKDSIP
jgi:N-acyl homoserine lactone hydrolase